MNVACHTDPVRRLVALAVVAGVLTGCSSGDPDHLTLESATPTSYAIAPAPSAPADVVAVPATAAAAVPAPAAASAPPPTTLAPALLATTVAPTPAPSPPPAPLPIPIDVPPDDGTTEPEVSLGAVEIPRLGLRRPLYEGIRMPTLDKGPGHWPGTAMPGELGNVVVAGHRVSHAADFRDLDELAPGDEVVFETATGRHRYLVVHTQIVEPEATWIVSQTADHRATLFACHPPGSVRQRIVVNLELASPPA